jgi:hypothetical protein
MNRRIPELFVPFIIDTQAKANSFEDAMNILEESYSFREVGTYLYNVKLDDRKILVDGKYYSASRWAIKSLCKMCGLSKTTTYLSPNYLISLINNIVKAKQEYICIFFDKAETKVINIVKANYYRANNADVLAMFRELNSKFNWHRKEISISERGIGLSLVTDLFGEIEPAVGDITKIGFSVINSETGGKPLNASFLLFRLQCQNGAVLRDKWGEVRWSYDKRMPIETSLKTFRRKLQNMHLPIELLEERFDGLLNNKLSDLDFKKIWRNLSRVVGTEEADDILEIEEEERKRLLKVLKDKEEKKRKSLDPNARIELVQLDKSFYDILQLITDKAKDYPLPTKQQLERLGGNIIE